MPCAARAQHVAFGTLILMVVFSMCVGVNRSSFVWLAKVGDLTD